MGKRSFRFNALVVLWFYLVLAISILLARSLQVWLLYLNIFVLLLVFNPATLRGLGRHLRPYLYFIPIMILLYISASLILTSRTVMEVMFQAGFTMAKIFLVIAIMSIYSQGSSSGGLMDAIRSLWIKTGLRWRWMEDFFMFLELTFRFFPAFQLQWEELQKSRKALGLRQHGPIRQRIAQVVRDLPTLLYFSLRRADETALSMHLRGYGSRLPRGIARPVPFTLLDLFFLVVLTCVFLIINSYGAL